MSSISLSAWKPESFNATKPISDSDLLPLVIQPDGVPLWTSNNPEGVKGDGWLMQNSRISSRGGMLYPLDKTFNVYLYHVNQSGNNKYLHLVVTNPNHEPITVTCKGSIYDTKDFPFDRPTGGGPCYCVAKDWLTDSLNLSKTVTIQPFKGSVLVTKYFPQQALVDGRFQITTTGGACVYTVVTSSSDVSEAIDTTQGEAALGNICCPAPNEFGRSAGICKNSGLIGTTEIEVPDSPAYLGLCLNTLSPQNQSSEYLMHLKDSSEKSFGNYGQEYKVTLRLHNPSSTKGAKVRVWFAHREVNADCSFTYNGPIKVDGKLIKVLTTCSKPTQKLVGQLTVAPGASQDVKIDFVVPGSITVGHQLILEVL